MNQINDYIAVFDSGVGGISVLRQLRRIMPCERFLYFGDSKNAPYGTRSTDEVRTLTLSAIERLIESYPIKAVVIACNTATAAAIKALRAKYPELIIIGIEPALKVAADHFPGGNIGVMATPVTLREEKFDILLHRFTESCQVTKIPAPGLVELIERGLLSSPETDALLNSLLSPYRNVFDAVVLGCTHYPFVAPRIQKILGERTQLLDGGEGTARETKRRLNERDLLSSGDGEVIMTNSLDSEEIISLSHRLLEEEL